MYLKSLEIYGFKSFAKKTVLNFNRGITAIVGPNGSGKSNIADALRWVMGEQSIKTLRGKKSEDVIFSGSDKKARLGMAEVSLYLDNSDHQAPIDYSELIITRRIFRNGESDYLINSHKSHLSDINLLLTQANFGHRTYSVIGQGMIDNFLISTPQERKEFFEEATGVKQYQIKKQQTLKKLNGVWQNLSTLKIKINEIEPRLKLLTRQVNKLKKRQAIENELEQLKTIYYHALWKENEQLYLQLKSQLEELSVKQNKAKAVYNKLEKQINDLIKNNSAIEEINLLRQKEKELFNQKMKFKEELIKAQYEPANKPQQHKAFNEFNLQFIENLKNNLLSLREMIGHLKLLLNQNKITESEKIVSESNRQIDNLIKIIEQKISPRHSQNPPENIKIPAPEKNNFQLKIEKNLANLELELKKLQEKIQTIETREQQNRSNLWKLQNNFNRQQQTINQLDGQIGNLRVELAKVETKRFDLKQTIQDELGGMEKINSFSPDTVSQHKHTSYRLSDKIQQLKNQLEIIGGIDPEIENEFNETNQRYTFLKQQLDDLEQTSRQLNNLIDELNQTIKQQIKNSYTEINKYFQRYFKILFNGGHAELVLLKKELEENDYNEDKKQNEDENSVSINFFQEKKHVQVFSGIEIYATPPGKKLKSIHALSGGERALTSIALICAIITSNPAPFVLLDEVDAALDEANSIRFSKIIKELSQKTQFIIITHNRNTMQSAQLLYGVTMGEDGVSKLISLKLEEAEKISSQHNSQKQPSAKKINNLILNIK